MRADEPVYEWEGFLCRRHPNRLIPENYRIPGQPVLTTICAKDKQPVLTCDRIREGLIAALPTTAEIAACELIAWCLMADHLHVLLRVAEQGGGILRFLHSYKTWTGRRMRIAGLSHGWERSFWDRHSRNSDDTGRMIAYVLDNPVRAGLCGRRDEWAYAENCWAPREGDAVGRGGT